MQEREDSNGNKTLNKDLDTKRSLYFLECEAPACVCVCVCVCDIGVRAGKAPVSRLAGWIAENMKVLQCIHFGRCKQHRDCFLNDGTIDENGVLRRYFQQ